MYLESFEDVWSYGDTVFNIHPLNIYSMSTLLEAGDTQGINI